MKLQFWFPDCTADKNRLSVLQKQVISLKFILNVMFFVTLL